ncbi:hypothetical protein [Paenibacillus lautus]|uniref:hypothetical protein n=1 Tax=Paenibacillus lautus TaxID=1401 RepID=UPI003D2D5853
MDDKMQFVEKRDTSSPQKLEQQLEEMNDIQKTSTNALLASQFPDWDLKPPVTLIKRRRSKLW